MNNEGMVIKPTNDTAVSPCVGCRDSILCKRKYKPEDRNAVHSIRNCEAFRKYLSVQVGHASGNCGYNNEDRMEGIEYTDNYEQESLRHLNIY